MKTKKSLKVKNKRFFRVIDPWKSFNRHCKYYFLCERGLMWENYDQTVNFSVITEKELWEYVEAGNVVEIPLHEAVLM